VSLSFDAIAEAYDHWYDTPKGQAIFKEEVECLQALLVCPIGQWLEVGVGAGRFAQALEIHEGLDPSPRMLEHAAARGIQTHEGCAEALPFPERRFEGILMALTLCFLRDPSQAFQECKRVLRENGRLLLGVVPANSPWGRAYIEKAKRGHPIYTHGIFRSAAEIVQLAQASGFALLDSSSALLWNPNEDAPASPRVETGIVAEAGFLGMLFTSV